MLLFDFVDCIKDEILLLIGMSLVVVRVMVLCVMVNR